MNEEQNRPLSTTDIAHGTSSPPDGGDRASDPEVRLVPEERSDDLRRQWEAFRRGSWTSLADPWRRQMNWLPRF
jgi:hypothetical protein